MLMDRQKLMIGVAIGFGLLLLAVGAILGDMSRAAPNPGETAEAAIARQNLGLVWGPAVGHFGMFLFVGGLVMAAVFLEQTDPFVRLFLLILGFVSLLLVLANSQTIFG